jgi:hypothetical protein
MSQLRTDESLQILMFVVAPASVLLVAALIFWVRSKPRFEITFPDFSIAVSRVGREEAYLVYREQDRRFEMVAVLGRKSGDGKKIYVQLPKEMPEDVARHIAANLVLGLTKLGYRYSIGTEGESQKVASGRSRES